MSECIITIGKLKKINSNLCRYHSKEILLGTIWAKKRKELPSTKKKIINIPSRVFDFFIDSIIMISDYFLLINLTFN